MAATYYVVQKRVVDQAVVNRVCQVLVAYFQVDLRKRRYTFVPVQNLLVSGI